VVFVVGVALTLACGGVLVWSGLDANAQGNQLITEAMQTHVRDPALESNVQTAEIRTDVLAVGTGVLGAATIALAFVTRWHGNTERAVAIAPTVNSAGAALSVVGRF
jgi:hypothetical protein